MLVRMVYVCHNFPVALIDLPAIRRSFLAFLALLADSVLGSCVARPRTTFINHWQRWGGGLLFFYSSLSLASCNRQRQTRTRRSPTLAAFPSNRCTKNTLINSDRHRLWAMLWPCRRARPPCIYPLCRVDRGKVGGPAAKTKNKDKMKPLHAQRAQQHKKGRQNTRNFP